MNGYELATNIRNDLGKPLPIVALTGWGETVSDEERDSYGINLVLAKPVRLQQLQEVLATL